MTLKNLFLFASFPFIFSCRNQQHGSTTNKAVTKTSLLNCYRYINSSDSFFLQTISANGNITGTLVYNFHEKDRSKGTIQGRMDGELLIADYSFYSEGVQSVRQVAFKKNGNAFIEGYGDAEDKNGKSIFKNIDSLNFNHSTIFHEIDCEK